MQRKPPGWTDAEFSKSLAALSLNRSRIREEVKSAHLGKIFDEEEYARQAKPIIKALQGVTANISGLAEGDISLLKAQLDPADVDRINAENDPTRKQALIQQSLRNRPLQDRIDLLNNELGRIVANSALSNQTLRQIRTTVNTQAANGTLTNQKIDDMLAALGTIDTSINDVPQNTLDLLTAEAKRQKEAADAIALTAKMRAEAEALSEIEKEKIRKAASPLSFSAAVSSSSSTPPPSHSEATKNDQRELQNVNKEWQMRDPSKGIVTTVDWTSPGWLKYKKENELLLGTQAGRKQLILESKAIAAENKIPATHPSISARRPRHQDPTISSASKQKPPVTSKGKAKAGSGLTGNKDRQKLTILLGSIGAGNRSKSINNKAMNLMDNLLMDGLMTKKEHEQLYNKYLTH